MNVECFEAQLKCANFFLSLQMHGDKVVLTSTRTKHQSYRSSLMETIQYAWWRLYEIKSVELQYKLK